MTHNSRHSDVRKSSLLKTSAIIQEISCSNLETRRYAPPFQSLQLMNILPFKNLKSEKDTRPFEQSLLVQAIIGSPVELPTPTGRQYQEHQNEYVLFKSFSLPTTKISRINSRLADTPIIWTAAKSRAKINYRCLTEIISRYYRLSLMRTLTQGPYGVHYKGR